MNKQELIDELKKLLEMPSEVQGHNYGLRRAIALAKQLDEPEKPVVPQFVTDYIDSEQNSCSTLSEALDNMDDEQRILDWFYINSETFAKAWLYGYEIEKEKRYTAKLKLTDEYLCCESQFKDLLHYKVPDSSAKEVKAYHFTEDDLVKYHIWGNDNYEVKKVEE